MADEEGNVISENLSAMGSNGADTAPQIGMLNQYIKDMSVENPNAPHSFNWTGQPQLDVQVSIQANGISEEISEVTMTLNVKASTDEGVQYNVELDYATLFGLRNLEAEQAHAFLFGEAPRLMFPFARRVIADAIRDTGFPIFVLEPVDFNQLYIQQRAQAAQLAEQQPAGEA